MLPPPPLDQNPGSGAGLPVRSCSGRERERSSSPPLSLSLGHPLAGQTLRRGIEMTGTEETPVVASKAEEVVKLNNSFKEACVITKSEQVDDKEKSH